MPDTEYIGVDWDSGEWLAVEISANFEISAKVYETMEELWNDTGEEVERIIVDVPIGLCGDPTEEAQSLGEDEKELSRECDILARNVLKPRRSSVFNPPCRAVVEEAIDRNNGYELKDDIYHEMNELNREITGKGLMQQGLSIAPGIAEVEDLILEDREKRKTKIVEGHPEVCFRALSDDSLHFSKRTAPGFAERLNLLESLPEYSDGLFFELAEELGKDDCATGIDDLVDALALAMTACGEELQSIPHFPSKDAEDLPMQMCYRRNEPFDDSELGLS